MRKKLQVFVSSTFNDLVTERQAAVETILKSGHIPAGMELFTAGDQSQMTVIKRWIDESDVYMLILGARYGSIEEKTGVSYTELEYDYAVEQNKPLFAIVISEEGIDRKVSESGKSILELSHGELLKSFRAKVLGKMCAFFSDRKDTQLAIFNSLPEFAADANLHGWVSGAEAAESGTLKRENIRLLEENIALKEQISDLKKTRTPHKIDSTQNTIEILSGTIIEIPANLTNDKKTKKIDLLSILINNKETLINGVTNAIGSGDHETFYYFNVAPKLAVHGLIANEKVAGVRYRRSYLTRDGLNLLAEIERRSLAKKSRASGA